MILFWKQIGLILQIVLVVAAVLLFSFFDPFGLLKSKKLNLEHTPINVKSIQEIGQLITAEYYGEVLNSLQQSRINQVMEENDMVEYEYNAIDSLYQFAISEFIQDKGSFSTSTWHRKNDLYEYFYYRFSSITDNPYYQDYIKWVLELMDKKNEKQLLAYFYSGEQKAFKEFVDKKEKNANFLNEIQKITDDRLNELSADKKFRKQQIVVLGRGWVKAGIDFGKFTSNNFKYDPGSKTVHLIGLKPEILVCTINPWFIPEKQVKGFEVLLVSRKANQPKYMQIVKEETLKKLRSNAIEANILGQAMKNAEMNLKDFFSLLIPDGVDQIIFHDDFFSYFDVSMTKDSLNPHTIRTIDSLLVKRFPTDSMEVMSLRDSLKYKRKVHVGDTSYAIQRFSALLTFIDDEELSSGELVQIEKMRDEIQQALALSGKDSLKIDFIKTDMNTLDTIWYYPDRKTLSVMLKMADQNVKPKKPFTTWQIISQNKKYTHWDSVRNETYHRMIIKYMLEQKIADYSLLVEQIKGHVSQVVIDNKTYVDAKLNGGKSQENPAKNADDQSIAFTDDIRKTISSALLFNNQTSISTEEMAILSDSLFNLMIPENPELLVPVRDSIKHTYVYCLSSDCYPIGRYTYILYGIGSDSINKVMMNWVAKEESTIQSDMDSLKNSEITNHLDRMDSVWFFPSQMELNTFDQQTDEIYPEDSFVGFFRKTFSGNRYKEWKQNRDQFYKSLIYNAMLQQKKEELQKTKSALLNEIETGMTANTNNK